MSVSFTEIDGLDDDDDDIWNLVELNCRLEDGYDIERIIYVY